MNPPEEIDARSECFDKNLIGVKREFQARFEKIRYRREKIFQAPLVLVHNHKVICVSDVMTNFQIALQKLIELIHVGVHKKLTREIAKRQADAGLALSMKTIDDFGKKPKRAVIFDAVSQDIF